MLDCSFTQVNVLLAAKFVRRNLHGHLTEKPTCPFMQMNILSVAHSQNVHAEFIGIRVSPVITKAAVNVLICVWCTVKIPTT